jgi:ATPase subunit of ABC transporter with duplicated ATPase domains
VGQDLVDGLGLRDHRDRAHRRKAADALGRLLFQGEAALKPTEALSGGECARLLLAKLLVLRHNVLILDEPTNPMDIESIERLLDGRRLFKGTIIFVSHDRHFVSSLATRVIDLRPTEGKGAMLMDYGGSYEEFLERPR